MDSDKVLELAIRRGFLWQSNEIYGGTAGFWDLGPYGIRIKQKIQELWRGIFVKDEGYYEIETPTILPEIVFIASGHVKKFNDPIVDCLNCKLSFRADHIIEKAINKNVEGLSADRLSKIIEENNISCPECGGELSQVRFFNLMFSTTIGSAEGNRAYARPETAQGMFVSFNRIVKTMHPDLPFGIVQLGKAYRNEISPRQGLLRVREFDQMEAEIFLNPEKINDFSRFDICKDKMLRLYPRSEQNRENGQIIEITAGDAVEENIIHNQFLAYYLWIATEFLERLGIPKDAIRCRQQLETEKAHYSEDTWDVEVLTGYGWIEVAGHAYRTDYDLKNHMKTSGKDLTYFISYEKPKKVKKTLLTIDKKKIGKEFGSDSKIVLNSIINNEGSIINAKRDGKPYNIQLKFKTINLCDYVEIAEKEETVSGERIIPHVIEPSYGVGRILWCVLEHAYREDAERRYLSLPPLLAPVDAAVFPLVSRDNMPEKAREIANDLKRNGLYVVYEEKASIGRRYARNDEIGVPFCITVDSQTITDNTVTLRERDSRQQVRVSADRLPLLLNRLLSGQILFSQIK